MKSKGFYSCFSSQSLVSEGCFSGTRYVGIGLFCFMVSACQTISNKASSSEEPYSGSLAMQVVKAAGVSGGLKDVPVSKLDHSMHENINTDALDLGLAVAHSQNLLTPPPGISNWGATGLHLLSIFATPTVQENEQSKLLVWMPATKAKDTVDAQIKMGSILEDAAIAALPEGYTSRKEQWM